MRVFWVDEKDKRRAELRDYAAEMTFHLPENCDYLAAVDEEDVLSGFSAVTADANVIDIRFLYVMKRKRRQQAAHLMLAEIERAVRESGGRTIRCVTPSDEELLSLFTKEGYELFSGETEYAVSFGALYYSDLYRKRIYSRMPEKAKTLSSCTTMEKKALLSFFQKEDIPLTPEDYDTSLSSVIFAGNSIVALLLCEILHKGVIVDYMYVVKGQSNLLLDCFRLLNSTLFATYGANMSNLMLSFSTGNDMEELLMRRFSGDIVPVEKFTREIIAVKDIGVDSDAGDVSDGASDGARHH